MSTTLDEPRRRHSASPAQRLRTTMAATRVSLRWFGVRKTLTPEQRAEAAEPFGAAGDFLSAHKKLVDTTHPAYKAVSAVRNKAVSYWRSVSLPYPEPGLRLIRQDKIDEFAAPLPPAAKPSRRNLPGNRRRSLPAITLPPVEPRPRHRPRPVQAGMAICKTAPPTAIPATVRAATGPLKSASSAEFVGGFSLVRIIWTVNSRGFCRHWTPQNSAPGFHTRVS